MSRPLLALWLVAAALLGGCRDEAAPPRQALPEDVLVAALVGAHIAAARAARFGEDLDSLRAVAFAAAGTDSLQVAAALDAYAERPAALARLYGRVTDQLREKQEAYFEAEHALAPWHVPFDEPLLDGTGGHADL